MLNYSLIEINDSNISSLQKLSAEALGDNYSFVKRTIDEWESGINTFSKHGERLWGIFINDECVAIGGLNQDPYIEDVTVGRVRHVYVAKNYRGNALSKVIMKLILDEAKKNFRVLRLSTSNPVASSLYESMGFTKATGYKVTHIVHLK